MTTSTVSASIATAAAPLAVAYLRSATHDEARLGRQRARVLARARACGRRISSDCMFQDRARSGGGEAATRPQLLALLTYCEAHPQPASSSGTVYVTDYCRLSRSPDRKVLFTILARLAAVGWRVETCEIRPGELVPPDWSERLLAARWG